MGSREHPAWRAFLPAITGIGLHQPGRYAAFVLKPIHNIWVYLLAGFVQPVLDDHLELLV
jgi:hypothetical protein